MSRLRIGQTIEIPGLPGKWSVWSQSADGPGCYFAVPEAGKGGYAVIRATQKREEVHPTIVLLRQEGPTDPRNNYG